MDIVFSEKLSKMKAPFRIAIRPFIARYYAFMGDYQRTVELLETSKQLPPQYASTDLAKNYQDESAFVALGLGDAEKFRRLLRIEAKEKVGIWRIEPLAWLAIDAVRSGNLEEARKLREEYMKEDRQLPVSLWTPPNPWEMERAKRAFSAQLAGEIAQREGNLDLAISHFQEVLHLVPPNTSGLDNILQPRLFMIANQSLAHTHEKKGEWNNAIKAYEAILQHKALFIFVAEASSIYFDALKSIGLALEKTGRPDEAAKFREEYRHIRP
jgi:tetratricopeptide (TPR) repeat protein